MRLTRRGPLRNDDQLAWQLGAQRKRILRTFVMELFDRSYGSGGADMIAEPAVSAAGGGCRPTARLRRACKCEMSRPDFLRVVLVWTASLGFLFVFALSIRFLA
jgi:hypothetical protein